MKPLTKLSRKAFLKAGLLPAAGMAQLGAQAAPQSTTTVEGKNAQFHLRVAAGLGAAVELIHLPLGIHLANAPYSYSFGQPEFAKATSTRDAGGTEVLTICGETKSGLEITQQFRIPAGAPWVEEQVTVRNGGNHVAAMPDGRCGFVLPVRIGAGTPDSPLRDHRIVAVPFRHEPQADRDEYADYSLRQVLTEPRRSVLRSYPAVHQEGTIMAPVIYETGLQPTVFSSYASEGWLLTDGRHGYLITKYSQQGMEWSVLDRVDAGRDEVGLRWGGFAIYQGDPEHAAWLKPRESHQFGVTRVTAYEGGVLEGFYAFRKEMESRGHGCPADFNPPVHWNELYDNKLYWFGKDMNNPDFRRKYYTLADMKEEAGKAKDIGCEALYLDPGWDTSFTSKIWDEARLGKMADFTAMLRRDYGLSLSLHTPLSGWCDPRAYPRTIDRMRRDGTRVNLSLCGASRQYVEESLSRFLALAEGGATYFMFDGDMYHGECWDPDHGHAVPAGREEHVAATNRLARLVHARYPQVLIEMHDQVVGGSRLRYVPLYYGHGRPLPGRQSEGHGFDSIWGFELMWDPMTDLVGRHSIALYYYNLAYSIPLYLHIDLRKDNGNALMFWWNASTCRHLGIGGTHSNPAVRAAQKQAMADYRRLEAFFKRGTFYGIDEMVHVHLHPSDSAAVINCFNLEDHPAAREVAFAPEQFGLDPSRNYSITGASPKRDGGLYRMTVSIPAYGHRLLEVR